ncbi:MAG: CapA family protein [Spirochaetes bacterium]|jgi:poly-gamma-glutamate synthesis protein (capsule biosynthesis protein)|nr:CapA family protein [Spirochaetota bacterium]
MTARKCFKAAVCVLSAAVSISCAARKPEPVEFSILFIGDILLSNEVEKRILAHGTGYPFAKIKDDMKKYNFIVGNLEAPISTRGEMYEDKAYQFEVDPYVAACLKDLEIDAVSISNNHLLDYGEEGMYDTIYYLRQWQIMHTGAGKNLEEAKRPAVFRCGPTEICLLSYCTRPPLDYFATEDSAGISPFHPEAAYEDITRLKKEGNIVLVLMHWGIEQTKKPQAIQKYYARKMIDAGADGIVGHHPHWPQGVEIYKGKPIIYSLGNFINGFYNKIEKDNIMAALYYHGNRLKKIEIIPIVGKNTGRNFQPYIMEGSSALKCLNEIRILSAPFRTSMDISTERGVIIPDMISPSKK